MALSRSKVSRTAQRAPTPGKKKSTGGATQKAVSRTKQSHAVRSGRSAKSATARVEPLLATSQKKIGTAKATAAVNPFALDPFTRRDINGATSPNLDPLAFAAPWMRFCLQMVAGNFALQVHVARTAILSAACHSAAVNVAELRETPKI